MGSSPARASHLSVTELSTCRSAGPPCPASACRRHLDPNSRASRDRPTSGKFRGKAGYGGPAQLVRLERGTAAPRYDSFTVTGRVSVSRQRREMGSATVLSSGLQ